MKDYHHSVYLNSQKWDISSRVNGPSRLRHEPFAFTLLLIIWQLRHFHSEQFHNFQYISLWHCQNSVFVKHSRDRESFTGRPFNINQSTIPKRSNNSRSSVAAPRKPLHLPKERHQRPCPLTAARCLSQCPPQTWIQYHKSNGLPAEW